MIFRLIAISMLVILVWWSGLIDMLTSDYSITPIFRGAFVGDDIERIAFQEYWITEIVDKDYKWRAMLWIPNQNNTGGFIEISYYERKDHWWEIW